MDPINDTGENTTEINRNEMEEKIKNEKRKVFEQTADSYKIQIVIFV